MAECSIQRVKGSSAKVEVQLFAAGEMATVVEWESQ